MNGVVFVTGAGGFVGGHVASYYEALGSQVVRIGHRLEPEKRGGEILVDADLNLKVLEATAGRHGIPSVVCHCAGSASVGFSIENPTEDFRRNVQLLSEVLEFSRRQSSQTKIIVLSSAAVYGDGVSGEAKREDMPLVPVSPYGLHKRLAEELCRFYASYWGIPVAVVRFFSIYGNGLRKQLLWDACKKLRAGNFVFEGTGEEERDWIHVDDAVRLIAAAVERASSACPVVNGGTGAARSVRSVLEALGAFQNPEAVPVFSGEARRGDPRSLVADVWRSKEWGITPKVDFLSGLRAYWDWFEREGEVC